MLAYLKRFQNAASGLWLREVMQCLSHLLDISHSTLPFANGVHVLKDMRLLFITRNNQPERCRFFCDFPIKIPLFNYALRQNVISITIIPFHLLN